MNDLIFLNGTAFTRKALTLMAANARGNARYEFDRSDTVIDVGAEGSAFSAHGRVYDDRGGVLSKSKTQVLVLPSPSDVRERMAATAEMVSAIKQGLTHIGKQSMGTMVGGVDSGVASDATVVTGPQDQIVGRAAPANSITMAEHSNVEILENEDASTTTSLAIGPHDDVSETVVLAVPVAPALAELPSLGAWTTFVADLQRSEHKPDFDALCASLCSAEGVLAKDLKAFNDKVTYMGWLSEPVRFLVMAMAMRLKGTDSLAGIVLADITGSGSTPCHDLLTMELGVGIEPQDLRVYSPIGAMLRKHSTYIPAMVALTAHRKESLMVSLSKIRARLGDKAVAVGKMMTSLMDSDPDRAFKPLAMGFEKMGAVEDGEFLRGALRDGYCAWMVLVLWLTQEQIEPMDAWLGSRTSAAGVAGALV